MGNDIDINNAFSLENVVVSKNMFEFLYVIGKGGFGKVWKVLYKKTQYPFALKEMSKAKIIDRKSEQNIINERNILSLLKHPFIINMKYAFQDKDYLYLVMDFLSGGDLRYHFSIHKHFSETQTKFFIACISLSIDYIHSNSIIHRDIKPENCICDEHGYVHITDFGVAKKAHKLNAKETSGTPGYMAPEVLCARNHTYVVDYFAIGVMGYEFMIGRRPYAGKNRKEIKQQVLSFQAELEYEDVPKGWSCEAVDFINKLIQRKPYKRLGVNGFNDIKRHKWFRGFDWEGLMKKRMEVPFIPKCGDNFDKKYCNKDDMEGTETMDRYMLYKKEEHYGKVFKDYTINNIKEDDIKVIYGSCPAHYVNITSVTKKVSRKGNTFRLYRDRSMGVVGVGYKKGEDNANGILLKKDNNIRVKGFYKNGIESYRSYNSGNISPLGSLYSKRKVSNELKDLPRIENDNKNKGLKYDKVSDNSHKSVYLRKTNSFMNVFDRGKYIIKHKNLSQTPMHGKYELLSPKITQNSCIPKERLYINLSNYNTNNKNSSMLGTYKYSFNKQKNMHNNSTQNKSHFNYKP